MVGKLQSGRHLPKQPVSKSKAAAVQVLTDKWISLNRRRLVFILKAVSDQMDNAIEQTTGGAEVFIWSTLTEEDLEVLVDVFTEAGKKSKRVAEVAYKIVSLYDRARVLAILGPRVYQTIATYFKRGIHLALAG